jgi:hypothetical protein
MLVDENTQHVKIMVCNVASIHSVHHVMHGGTGFQYRIPVASGKTSKGNTSYQHTTHVGMFDLRAADSPLLKVSIPHISESISETAPENRSGNHVCDRQPIHGHV